MQSLGKMAATQVVVAGVQVHNQLQCLSAQSNVSCATCILVKKRYNSVALYKNYNLQQQLLIFFDTTLLRQLPIMLTTS
jgi:hypothetical protein